jgi:predicted RNase H-like HicB family nuclease
MHDKAVKKGLLKEIRKDGRTASFEIEQSLKETTIAGSGGVVDVEAKKADIERRRPTSYINNSKDKKTSLESFRNESKREWDGVSVITGVRMQNLYTGIQLFVEAYPEHKELLDKFIKEENGNVGITNNNLSFVLNTLKKQGVTTESELGSKINAKYDAELDALVQSLKETPIAGSVGEEKPLLLPPPPPLLPPSGTSIIAGAVPEPLLTEVKEALRLHEKALESDTTFKEEADNENYIISNNRINDFSNTGKNEGTFNLITSNPDDLEGNRIKEKFFNLVRFNFTNNLLKKKLEPSLFKLIIQEEKGGQLKGIVADKKGNIITFGEDGIPQEGGVQLHFLLDWDVYNSENIVKKREEVVLPPKKIAPLTSTPVDLHPSFVDVDPIALLRMAMKNSTVTASIDFITQGMLYREGVTNSLSKIPKNKPTKTAATYIADGHTTERKGVILQQSNRIGGRYLHNWRLHFSLLNDLNDKNSPSEIVEFHPLTIGEVTNNKGEKLTTILKTEKGENIFEAAIKGDILATPENIRMLRLLLRPDKFHILNTGSHLLVINLKNFKKLLRQGDISYEKLIKATNIGDVYNSPLNINLEAYNASTEVKGMESILDETVENYSMFIHNNVVSSTLPLKVGEKEGYHTVNKRLAIKIDQNISDIKNILNKQKIEENSPENKVVNPTPEEKPTTTVKTTEERENISKTKVDGITLNTNDSDLFDDLCP